MSSPRGVSSAASTAASSDSYQDAVVKIRPSKLFIGGLTKNTTTKQLREHFSKYGRVLDCIAMRQPDGKARGFGYVTLDTIEAACLCVSEPQKVDGRIVDVKHAVADASRKKDGGKAAKVKPPQKLCPRCAKCAECASTACGSDSESCSGHAWTPERTKAGGWSWAGGTYAKAGATMNTKMWNSSWGLDGATQGMAWGLDEAPPGLAEGAGCYSSLPGPVCPPPGLSVCPPPGLPMPRGMSIFRTPSSSECSSRASSPARSDAGSD